MGAADLTRAPRIANVEAAALVCTPADRRASTDTQSCASR
jgi:hypothetical protein